MCFVDNQEEARLVRLGGPTAIGIEVSVDPPAVGSGGTVKLTVSFKNETSAPRTIIFHRCSGDPALSVEVLRGGERADLAPSDFGCAADRGCLLQRVALTLAPGGTATTRGKYRAQKKKLVPPCEERPIGPLPHGEYTLRITTPLMFLESPGAPGPGHRTAEVPLRVGK